MEYTTHSGTSNAVFYYDNSNLFSYGRVAVNSDGEITRVWINSDAENDAVDIPFDLELLQQQRVTRITFNSPRAVSIPKLV